MNRIYACITGEKILASPYRHHNLLQRSVAGTLTQAIYSAFNLSRSVHDCRQGICYRQPEVVMAMHRKHHLIGIGYTLAQGMNELSKLLRHRVANGVGYIHGGGTRINNRLQNTAEECDIRAACIFG